MYIMYSIFIDRSRVTSLMQKYQLFMISSLNMHFLRPCIGPGIRAEGTMVRIGKTLAVIDVRIFGDGHDDPAALATVTYALPKDAQA